MTPAVEHIRSHREEYLEHLREILRIPSVSSHPERAADLRRAAEWVRHRLAAAGCTRTEIHETGRHPIVYGEWIGASDRPTILVYGHYDVQPADPPEAWTSPPFEPTIRDGRIYARGASDDKGQFLVHVNALEAHLRTSRACPAHVKFLLEGEEEIGSPHVEAFLASHRKLLRCDAVVVSDTPMLAKGVPSICHGLRGIAGLRLEVRGSDRDLHSGSFGGAVINPLFALATMVAALKDDRGKVRVPGFYGRVRRPGPAERKRLATLAPSEARYRKSIGAPALWGEAGYTTLERTWIRPTLEINGIEGGFTGKGAKTVIPGRARATISMRLAPDQKPEEISRSLERYLRKVAPRSVEVAIERGRGREAWRAPTERAALKAAARALRRAFGKPAVFVLEGGSIPVVGSIDRMLGAPVVLMGFGLPDDNLHAPNEKLDLDNFDRGMEASALFMEELGRDAHPTSSGSSSGSRGSSAGSRGSPSGSP